MGRPGTGVCRASWCAIAPTKQSRSSLSTAGLVSGSKHGSTLSLEPLLVRSSRRLLLHLPPMCLAVRQCVLSPASSGMRQKYAQTCSSMLSGTGRATATSSSAATDMALATMPSALSPVHAPARIFAQVTWADRDEVGRITARVRYSSLLKCLVHRDAFRKPEAVQFAIGDSGEEEEEEETNEINSLHSSGEGAPPGRHRPGPAVNSLLGLDSPRMEEGVRSGTGQRGRGLKRLCTTKRLCTWWLC